MESETAVIERVSLLLVWLGVNILTVIEPSTEVRRRQHLEREREIKRERER
jgi:hypothetical protein